MKEFDPVEAGLDASFRLIDFTGLKGWGCKVPQEKLLKLLSNLSAPAQQIPKSSENCPHKNAPIKSDEIGIGLDCCVQPIPQSDLFLVQTTDYFYPLINDPYKMGWIACNNVISDLYAMGVSRIGEKKSFFNNSSN